MSRRRRSEDAQPAEAPELEVEPEPESPEAEDEPGADDADGAPRKERVLHTRVPAVLEQELKRLATNLRVPVSNVVRAMLEDAVAAVDRVGHRAEGELRGAADRLHRFRQRTHPSDAPEGEHPGAGGEPPREARPILAGILGWQPLLLAADGTCTLCGRQLSAGDEAFLGVREGDGPRVILGPECLPGGRKNKDKNSKHNEEHRDD